MCSFSGLIIEKFPGDFIKDFIKNFFSFDRIHLPCIFLICGFPSRRSTPSFPFHRCSDYASSSLPYELSQPVETTPGMYCMTITFKGPIADPSTCYNVLSSVGGTRLTMGVRE